MRITLEVESRISEIPKVYDWLKEVIEPLVEATIQNHILLVVQEMVTNAIVHGNKEIAEKRVRIDLHATAKQIVIRIEDEGSGLPIFPTKEEAQEMNYMEENGRGIKLAVMLSDQVIREDNRVTLIYHRNK
jgi:serine/threonine-protein kinase RsbW